jgi:photosystem II stability/assembly factor-like uncharacterized protein
MSKLLSWPRVTLVAAVAIVIGVAAGAAIANRSVPAETLTLSELAERTHIHGLAVDRADPSRLYIATHHGFFVASPEGVAPRLSATRDDLMGFTPHPSDASVLYASGHPAGGGNLGFIVSTDGGRSWEQLAEGVGGPVDFHQMDVSKADPDTIYGVYRGLQVSRDGGHTWEMVGPAPEGLIDLAASARDVETLYAATETGLRVSRDGGRSWQDAFLVRRPATMVETTADGTVYAFMVGTGLLRASEPDLSWDTLGGDFGDEVVLHLAVDPANPQTLYAATHHGGVLVSTDGGATWSAFGAG